MDFIVFLVSRLSFGRDSFASLYARVSLLYAVKALVRSGQNPLIFSHMHQLLYAPFFPWLINYLICKLIAGLLQHLRSRRLTSFLPCTVKESGSQKKRKKSSKRSQTM